MSTESNQHTGTIAVVGATGQQGGATADALMEAGAAVRALVRDPGAPAAQRLAENGAQLVTADLDRPESLVPAFEGAAVVFAMTTFSGPDGPAGEVQHGRAIGDAARAAGVPRIVYSSVGGAERHTGIPHFESKRRVEEYLETLGPRTTFLRPAFFMENFASFFTPTTEDGTVVVRLPLPADVPLQMVATRDIGRIAAAVLMDPDLIPGGAVEVAGDELTGEQVAATFADATGHPGRYEPISLEALAGNPDQQAMFSWFARLPAYQADFTASRELLPDLQNLRTWLATR